MFKCDLSIWFCDGFRSIFGRARTQKELPFLIQLIAVNDCFCLCLMGNRNQRLAGGQLQRQRCVDGQHAVLAERRLYRLGIDALGQQEFAVVLTVHHFCVGLFFVLGVHLKKGLQRVNLRCYEISIYKFQQLYQQLLVDGLDDNFLRSVLADVETQLQHLAVTIVL